MTEAGEPVVRDLAVIGLGLLGGSVALAARARGAVERVCAVDPAVASAPDIPLVSLEEAAAADLIVLAVPPAATESVVAGLAPHLKPEAILTDVASVKGPMSAIVHRWLERPERVVGAHPMAGGDRSGFASARADLFEGRPCILTPAGSEPPSVVDRVEEFWQCLGAFTVQRTPEQHDAISAALSHAPHVIAYAFARGLPDGEDLALAGPGLRDFIRIARANPALWCEILLMNRDRVTEEVARFQSNLEGILEALHDGDGVRLEAALQEGRRSLGKLGS